MKSTGISLRGMIYASLLGAITAVGAYVIIPLPPVPITLQTLFTALSGALLGGGLGALAQAVYVLLGIIGLPVFAGGKAGLGVLLGPTGGYLIGFMAGAYLIGKLIDIKKEPGFAWIVFSMILGYAAIYLLGILQLMLVAKFTLVKALSVGLLPFLIGDALKILAATLVTLKLRDRIRGRIGRL
ncbi:MAG: biotin transporter BioY [Deltaproteobacteria bacterium]|nr:biotin transporter BioY [Deltaproteobacteria bacterium]MBW2015229.1 biotin transporter BioY [Deltaproteobacteria bacterium]MBW2128530.1 biotin transporter BioY [Deltaproteobacteria bacterium]MBW2302370.1 biotin transporter BioY [Deltaproteobacteria bacterium]